MTDNIYPEHLGEVDLFLNRAMCLCRWTGVLCWLSNWTGVKHAKFYLVVPINMVKSHLSNHLCSSGFTVSAALILPGLDRDEKEKNVCYLQFWLSFLYNSCLFKLTLLIFLPVIPSGWRGIVVWCKGGQLPASPCECDNSSVSCCNVIGIFSTSKSQMYWSLTFVFNLFKFSN